MHETRNFLLVIGLVGATVWAVVAWFVFGPDTAMLPGQRFVSVALIVLAAAGLVYAFFIEDKLPDRLREVIGDMYYEVDGLCFMPIVRQRGQHAELCVYYQNRFENPVQAVVHLRPPDDSFIIRPGVRDVHFAFKADGGDFGVIHQPIAVPRHLQGDVLNIQLAAASWYPRSHGACLIRRAGMPCGTMLVDWGGAAFKTGVHEVSGEVELRNPITLHLSMPDHVRDTYTGTETWRQEQLAAGMA
jgi:hypothetical protein